MPDRPPQHRSPPRKAPRQARSAETVRVIVEGAARVLERGGLDGFSTNAVAVEAGVSVGSVYQYFPAKDALIGALIVRETALLIEEAEAAATEAGGEAVLSGLILACIAHQLRRPVLARLLDFEEARLPFDPDVLRVSERFRAIVDETLLRADLPRQADPAAAARDVAAIIKGMIDAAGIHGETGERALATRVERAVFGYLRTPLRSGEAG